MLSDDLDSEEENFNNKMTTSVRRPPPPAALEGHMLSDDDIDEIEIAPDGSRIYKAKSVKSHTNSTYLGLGSRSNSRLGGNSVYGGSHRAPSVYGGNYSMYGSSQPVLSRPKSVCGGSHSVYGGSQPVFSRPQSVYADNHSVYGGSQPVFRRPQSVYGGNRSVYGGNRSVYGGSRSAFREFNFGNDRQKIDIQSQYEPRWRHRDISPTASVRSLRNLNPNDVQSLQMIYQETLENLVYPLEQMMQQAQLRGQQQRRRVPREIDRDSEENTDDSFESGRFSTRSELPMRHRRLRPMNHPYARREGPCSVKDRYRSFSRFRPSSRQNDFDDFPLFPNRVETDLRRLACTAETVTPKKNPLVQRDASQKENTAALGNTKQNESIQKEHVFAKPKLRGGKTPAAKPTSAIKCDKITSTKIDPRKAKRLSEVSEIPEITENTIHDSTKSFLKRKLFTRNSEMTKEKNVNEDSASDSPSPEATRQSYRRDLVSRPSTLSNKTGRSSVISIASMHDLLTNLIGPATLNQTKANAETLINTNSYGGRAKENKETFQANPSSELALNMDLERKNHNNGSFSLRSLVEKKNKVQNCNEKSNMNTPKVNVSKVKQNKEGSTKQNNNQVKVIHTPLPVPRKVKKSKILSGTTTPKENTIRGKVTHTPVLKMKTAESESKTMKDTPKQSKPGKVVYTPIPKAKASQNYEKTYTNKPCTSQNKNKKQNLGKNKNTDKEPVQNKSEIIKDAKEANNSTEFVIKSGNAQTVQFSQTDPQSKAIKTSKKVMNQESTRKSVICNDFVRESKVLTTQQIPVNSGAPARQPGFQELSDSDDPEVSFRFDKASNMEAPNLTNSSGDNGLRRSARKSRKPNRFSDFVRTHKGDRSGSADTSGRRGQKREASRDDQKMPAEKQQKLRRSVSPTFTASDMGSPRLAVLNAHLTKCADMDRVPRRSPRINKTQELPKKTKPVPRAMSREDKENKRPIDSIPQENRACAETHVDGEVERRKTVQARSVHIDSKNVTQHKETPVEAELARPQKGRAVRSQSARIDSKDVTQNKAPATVQKQAAPSQKSKQDAIDSFLEDSSADEMNKHKSQKAFGQQKSSFARLPDKPGALKPVNSSIASLNDRSVITTLRTADKSNSVADLTANSAHQFKQPFKVPAQKPAALSQKSKKNDYDSFLEDSSADEMNIFTHKAVGQQKNSFARPLEKPGALKPVNSSIASLNDRSASITSFRRTGAKSSSIADLTANGAREFKQPFKAPVKRAKTSAGIRMGRAKNNASLLSNSSNTSVRRKANNSKLPDSILELLGPDFQPTPSDEEGDADQSVRQRVNKLRSTRRPSPTRSVRSEMIRPSRSLVDRVTKNFYEDSSRFEPEPSSHKPGYTHLTVGVQPRFFRAGHSRNTTRFDDNASVVSGPSVTSFRSLSHKYSTLHF